MLHSLSLTVEEFGWRIRSGYIITSINGDFACGTDRIISL